MIASGSRRVPFAGTRRGAVPRGARHLGDARAGRIRRAVSELLATMRSVEEIAEDLAISTNTVKATKAASTTNSAPRAFVMASDAPACFTHTG